MASQAGGRAAGASHDGSNATGGGSGASSSAGLGFRIARPAAHRIESADSHEGQYSPSIQDILVALPADLDPLQSQQALEGPTDATLPPRSQHAPQFGDARRFGHPYLLPEHRPRSVSLHFQPDHSQTAPSVSQVMEHQQQLPAATAALGEVTQLHPRRSGFVVDGWGQTDHTQMLATEITYHQTQGRVSQRPQHQKRRRTSKTAKMPASQRQRRLSEINKDKVHPGPSTVSSPSSVASDEEDDGSSPACALSATRSQIDVMTAESSNAALRDLGVHSKRKRPVKRVHKPSVDMSNQELPRPPLHLGSSGSAAETMIEEKPAAPSSAQPSTNSELQRGALVTASGGERHQQQATCRVSWCTQPGKRFGLCWTHGGVKKCCESNCARVALETSEFCSFHQPKHSSVGRTTSI